MCRQKTTSAPVPLKNSDNIIENIVVPQMNEEAKSERNRRKGIWAKNKNRQTAKMEQLHKRPQEAIAPAEGAARDPSQRVELVQLGEATSEASGPRPSTSHTPPTWSPGHFPMFISQQLSRVSAFPH